MVASEQTSAVLERLRDSLQKSQRGWLAQCPAHEDSTASLSIREGRDGRVLLYCFAGCEVEDVVAGLGMEMSDLFQDDSGRRPSRRRFPPPRRERPVAKPKEKVPLTFVEAYLYRDEDGNPSYEVQRFEPKTFKQRHVARPGEWYKKGDVEVQAVGGEWVWGLDGVRRLIYQLPEVLATIEREDLVFIVEGEKDVDRLKSLGFTATCNSGGALSWPTDAGINAQFFGARVIIIPDNDKPNKKGQFVGELHAADVKQKLEPYAREIMTLTLPKEYKDVSDFLDAGGQIVGLS